MDDTMDDTEVTIWMTLCMEDIMDDTMEDTINYGWHYDTTVEIPRMDVTIWVVLL